MAARRSTQRPDERGQVLIIVAFAFVAIIMLLALVFDGARGLVMRRELQNSSDAAALAAANIVQTMSPRGCSATGGPPPGAPQAAIVAAAKASVAINLPDYPQDEVVVSCPTGWDNYAVQVTLSDMSPTFFGSIFGSGGLDVIAKSSAVNGQTTVVAYSVILLDPGHITWPNGRRGCPAFSLSGGPTVTFDSSLYINSACDEPHGGALSTNGNAASLTMGTSGSIRLVGEYAPGALTISPAPMEYQVPRPDPLATLIAPSTTGMTVRRTVAQGKLIQNGGAITLEPGVYNGGIELRSSAKAYLRPGIYVIQGGGLDVGAQAELYSIEASATTTTSATWATDCPKASCGVLIYNAGTASGSTAMGQVKVAAGAVVKVRAYNPDFLSGVHKNETYRNLLIWQDASPVPTSTYGQPELSLTGGGGVDVGGTVYAPSANVRMGGSSGGSGGDSIDLTLQFISWSIELHGNSSFHFRYNENEFAKPLDYGLVE
jgi:hypothetical protein